MTLTKEWLLKTIAELEEERDAVPGVVNEDAAKALAAMKLALASLEADPVVEVCEGFTLRYIGHGPAPKSGVRIGERLYTAPPAPVSMPDENGLLPCPFCGSPAEHYPDGDMEGYSVMCGHKNGDCNSWIFGFATPEEAERSWNTRAAMLQGAEPVTTAYKLPAIGWLRADYQDDNRGLRGNAPLFVLGKKDPSTVWGLDYIPLTSNSPVIPDGWVACSERMPEKGRTLALFGKRIKEVCANYVDEGYIGDDGEFYFFDWEGGPRIDDCHPYDKAIVTHWMYWELPAAPRQEV